MISIRSIGPRNIARLAAVATRANPSFLSCFASSSSSSSSFIRSFSASAAAPTNAASLPSLSGTSASFASIPLPGTPSKSEVKFTLNRPFKGHKLTAPESIATSSQEELLTLFRSMAYYRRFEIVADTMYKQRLIRGFCHLYDGQEAIVTGIEAAITKGDSIITSYRDHCQQISRGDTGARVMAELFGKKTGCSKGKGGSMHMYYNDHRFYGGNGIVGAQTPVGAGIAFAHKYNKDGGLCISMYGDGAANQGQLYEAANMAALWKLPVIFLCENNEYGMGTSRDRAAANPHFYNRDSVVPGLWIDGMDVLAVKAGIKFAADYCRSGKGPLFVECQTYRYHGHSMSDPGISYRSRDEVQNVRATRDPIDYVKNLLLKQNWITEEQLKTMDKQIRKQVDEEVEFAKNSEELPVNEMYTEIYRHGPQPPFLRAVDFRQSVEVPQ